MKKYPLQLNTYFYIHNHIEPNPRFDINEEPALNFHISALIQEDGKNLNCAVNVSLNQDKKGNFPYTGVIRNYGVFTPEESLSKEEAIALVKTTGVNILVGAIREKLMTETSSGPFPALFMPPVDISKIEFN